jgi:hypothetical protein
MSGVLVAKLKVRIGAAALVLLGLFMLASPANAAAGWQPRADVSGGPDGEIADPRVAIDPDGNAIAVWRRVVAGGFFVIQAASKPAGGSWEAPVDLSSAGGDSTRARIAFDPQGNATAVWRRSEGGIIEAASKPAGGAWEPRVAISAIGGFDPQIAFDSAGNAILAWESTKGIQVASKPAGGAWQAPVAVSAVSNLVSRPRVGFDSANNAIVVWQKEGSGTTILEAARRPAGGGWEAPVDLSLPGQPVREMRSAIDAAGNVTAAYATNGNRIQAATKPAGGGWEAPVTISPGTSDEVEQPQVAVDPAGNAVVVWKTFTTQVWAASKPAGGGWEAPGELTIPAVPYEQLQRGIDVGADASGNFTAVWQRYDGLHGTIVQAATKPPGGAWGAPVDISVSEDHDDVEPQIAINSAGSAVAVWRHSFGRFEGLIQAASYEADNAPQISAASVAPNVWGGGGGTSRISVVATDDHSLADVHAIVTYPKGTELEVPLEAVGPDSFEGSFAVPFNPTKSAQSYSVAAVAEDGAGQITSGSAGTVTVEQKGTPNPGFLTVEPAVLRFGAVSISGGEQVLRSFVLRNAGKPGSPLVSGVLRTGNSQFLLPGATEGGVPFTLAPGEEETFEVGFQPTSKGQQNAHLSLNRSDGRQPNTSLALFGWGLK